MTQLKTRATQFKLVENPLQESATHVIDQAVSMSDLGQCLSFQPGTSSRPSSYPFLELELSKQNVLDLALSVRCEDSQSMCYVRHCANVAIRVKPNSRQDRFGSCSNYACWERNPLLLRWISSDVVSDNGPNCFGFDQSVVGCERLKTPACVT